MESTPDFNSWQEIIDFYHKYLSGEVQGSPTHSGPLESESAKILPQLLAINRLGILTVDSQPGINKKKSKGTIYHHEKKRDATNIQFHQRAYLDCYMYSNQYAILKDKFDLKEFLIFGNPVIQVTGLPVAQVENCGVHLAIPVTIAVYTIRGKTYKVTETETPLSNWDSPDMEFILENSPPEAKEEITKDLIEVRITDPIWGREAVLFDEIIAAFNRDVSK